MYLSPTFDDNPFTRAAWILALVDAKIRRLEALKQNGEKMGKLRWQQISLNGRRYLNNLFEAVEKAREHGW